MRTSFRIIVALLASLALQSCGSLTSISFFPVETYPDGSELLSVATWRGGDSMAFGSARLREDNIVVVGAKGDSVVSRVWYPGGAAVDDSRLVILIPGYGESALSLFPLALETVRRGMPTMMLNPRGTGMNHRLAKTYGVAEIDDARAAILAFKRRHRRDSVRVGVFGTSLGGVMALNIARRDLNVRAVAVEGVMPALDAAARDVMSSDDYEGATTLLASRGETMDVYSPQTMLPFVRPIPILMLWGSDDPLVDEDQRMVMKDMMRARVATSVTAEIPGAGHTMRYGFPLGASEARALNERIAKFLEESLR